MAVNYSVEILWTESPRLILVPAPDTDITIQDLVDTCRYNEAETAGIDDAHLVDAAGKEFLGGTTYVGLTATLQNAQLIFEARSTPLLSGSTVTTANADGVYLIDSGGSFTTDGLYAGCTIYNTTSGAMATLKLVVSDGILYHFPLSGGSRTDWQVGDGYLVYPNVQCNVSGGNLVAVDANGSNISPILQSPNVQVVRAASSSATLQQAELEAQVIADAVWDEPLAPHTTAGTYGAELATKSDIHASTATHYTAAASASVVYGSVDSGTYTDTAVRDDTYWEIHEDATNGITVEFTFNLPGDDHRPGSFDVFGHYIGTPGTTHYLNLWAYNYEATTWEMLAEEYMPGGLTSDTSYSYEYREQHVDRDNSNEVKIRLVHNPTTYNAAHELFLDYVAVSSVEVVTAEDLANAVWAHTVAVRLLGLSQENYSLDQTVYTTFNGQKLLTSARLRVYDTAAHVGTATGVVGTYTITSAWTEDEMTSYQVVKQ